MCVCVYTYMIMFISLYIYIFIDIYISIVIFTSSIYTNTYIYTYIHIYIYIYILSPSLFSKISCCSLRFFLTPPGPRLQLLLPFDLLLPSIGRRPLPNLTALAVLTPKKGLIWTNQPTNPQEISGKHTFAVSFFGGFFPPWKITSMGFVRFL